MATLDRLVPPAPALPVEGQTWKPRRAIAAVLTAAAAIALLQVIQSSSFAHTGYRIQQLEAERTTRAAAINQLEAEVAALSSLDRVERAARERLDMVPARNLTYIAVDVESPSGPLLPRPILSPSPAPPGDVEPWWQSLLKALPLR
jgi:cell division protein FtsB